MQSTSNQFPKRAASMDEFCYRYNVGRTFVYSEIAANRLQSIKIGRKRLIPSESGEEWFSRFYPAPKPKDSKEDPNWDAPSAA